MNTMIFQAAAIVFHLSSPPQDSIPFQLISATAYETVSKEKKINIIKVQRSSILLFLVKTKMVH